MNICANRNLNAYSGGDLEVIKYSSTGSFFSKQPPVTHYKFHFNC